MLLFTNIDQKFPTVLDNILQTVHFYFDTPS